MKRFLLPVPILFSLIFGGPATAVQPAHAEQAAPDAATIIKNSDKAMKPQTEKTRYRMTLVAPDGSVEQVRTFFTYYKKQNGEERTRRDYWISLSLRYQWFDYLEVSATCDWLGGEPDGVFGQFHDRDRIVVAAKVFF